MQNNPMQEYEVKFNFNTIEPSPIKTATIYHAGLPSEDQIKEYLIEQPNIKVKQEQYYNVVIVSCKIKYYARRK